MPIAKGHVYTARGEKLDFDGLIEQAKRPLGYKEPKSEVKATTVPKGPLNVRGFTPSQGESKTPVASVTENALEPSISKVAHQKSYVSSFTQGEATSMADLTGIKVEKTPSTPNLKRGEGLTKSQEVLGEILNDLSVNAPKAHSAATKDDHRKKKAEKDGKSNVNDVTEVE